jgi:hypothetical protein
VTALAASHCFRVVSYTAGISRPKALVAGEGYHVVVTDDSANRMARQREGDKEVSFFWGWVGRGVMLLLFWRCKCA